MPTYCRLEHGKPHQQVVAIATEQVNSVCVQAGLGPAVAAVFLQPSEFGENLETSTLQNAVNDPQQPPEDLTAQYVTQVHQHCWIIQFDIRSHAASV